jgi:hypothetical protein
MLSGRQAAIPGFFGRVSALFNAPRQIVKRYGKFTQIVASLDKILKNKTKLRRSVAGTGSNCGYLPTTAQHCRDMLQRVSLVHVVKPFILASMTR